MKRQRHPEYGHTIESTRAHEFRNRCYRTADHTRRAHQHLQAALQHITAARQVDQEPGAKLRFPAPSYDDLDYTLRTLGHIRDDIEQILGEQAQIERPRSRT